MTKKKGVETGIIKKINKKSKTNKNNWSPNNKSCGWFSHNGKPTYIGCPTGEYPINDFTKDKVKFDGTCVFSRNTAPFVNAYKNKHKIKSEHYHHVVPGCKLTGKNNEELNLQKMLKKPMDMPRGICMPIKDNYGRLLLKEYLTPDEIKYSQNQKLFNGNPKGEECYI